jgi:predicted short-subunit dehydrogenase-like oxidoreductase (DUF2520 family)
VALESEAAELMRAASDEPDALQLLGPLVRTTVENLLAQGPERALTGPVVRGDVSTVRAHLALIGEHEARYAAAYRALSAQAAALAAPRLDDETLHTFHRLFADKARP